MFGYNIYVWILVLHVVGRYFNFWFIILGFDFGEDIVYSYFGVFIYAYFGFDLIYVFGYNYVCV